jgi:two-component system sensor histidine kinase ArlS
VDNACKYSDKDVEISLFEKEGRRVVEIRDQGIGIPQEEVELIFQSFYRASNTRSYKGQGIGLSLSLKIISTYGGQMGIHSEEGHFTTVSITFPLSLAEE